MRITEAARRLGTSPRMLRYRDSLGLLPAVREPPWPRRPSRPAPLPAATLHRPPGERGPAAAHRPPVERDPGTAAIHRPSGERNPAAAHRPPGERDPGTAAAHRQFGERDLDAVALALAIERRYDVSPAALAFGLRVLTEPGVRAEVAELGRRIGRIQAPAARALDFEQERALRLLSMSQRPRRPPARSPSRR
jgi:MerR family transcriptional regulator, copper efflux regulator